MKYLAIVIIFVVAILAGLFIGIFIGVGRMKKSIEEQSVVKFSIGLSKNDDVNNTDWSTYFTNLSVVSQYSSFKPIDVAVQNIVVENGRVLIKGKNGSVANVYNVSGMKLRSQFIDNDDYVLSDLPKNQLLLMVIDNDSKKLILR